MASIHDLLGRFVLRSRANGAARPYITAKPARPLTVIVLFAVLAPHVFESVLYPVCTKSQKYHTVDFQSGGTSSGSFS